MIGPALLAAGLAVPLAGALGLAIRRSTRRQECARLRDQLVDAARLGELDLADWRVFSLIDWFDQVATTGRTGLPGRHAHGRHDPVGSLAHSLAATLIPLGPPGLVGPAPAPAPALAHAPALTPADLRAIAVAYRERHQRVRCLPRRPPLPRPRVAVTGRSDRAEWLDAEAAPAGQPVLPLLPSPPSSLVEEIFAVAASGR